MFRNVAKISLRRGLHTARANSVSVTASASRHRVALALGTSAAMAGYLAYQIQSGSSPKIALDAAHSEKLEKRPSSPTETIVDKALDKPVEAVKEATSAVVEGDAPAEDGEAEEGSTQQAAYDPVTGKINWDCPCLGGMAYGPCGQHFREAFSCFVFSEAEPKGIDCVDAFKAMQQCFRDNPEVYGEEILGSDDDDEDFTPAPADSTPATADATTTAAASAKPAAGASTGATGAP
ncbi:hypothetical protein PENSPDRAFT_676056 [Peniophora sp. CONT]|nr:hypothetical protein PENSPDRAFT_676056 [Peniophora sp. CONT]